MFLSIFLGRTFALAVVHNRGIYDAIHRNLVALCQSFRLLVDIIGKPERLGLAVLWGCQVLKVGEFSSVEQGGYCFVVDVVHESVLLHRHHFDGFMEVVGHLDLLERPFGFYCHGHTLLDR